MNQNNSNNQPNQPIQSIQPNQSIQSFKEDDSNEIKQLDEEFNFKISGFKYNQKKFKKNRNKNKKFIREDMLEDISIYEEENNINKNNSYLHKLHTSETNNSNSNLIIKTTSSSSIKEIGSPTKSPRIKKTNSYSQNKIKEYKDNIRKNSSYNIVEGLITGISNNYFQILSNDDEQNIKSPTIITIKSKNNFEDDYSIEGINIDIEEPKVIPLYINESYTKNKKNKMNKLNKTNKTDKTDLNQTQVQSNIKNISDINDLDKKINDITDYNFIHTPFKVIGEDLLNEEINTKFKNKNKVGQNESQIIIKKLKDTFKKLVISDVKDKPNLSGILLDNNLSEDLKLKIIRKYIKYTTEDEVFSDNADKIRIEINNLLKAKKIRASNDFDDIYVQIENKIMPTVLKEKLEDLYFRIIGGDENKLTNLVNNIIRLPYHKVQNPLDTISDNGVSHEEQVQFINQIYKKLDENLFGLTEVKDSILSYICQKINNPTISTSKYLCLCGPAGVGKTSIVHAISEALNIPYSYISLANIDTPSTLIGHDYTYEGSTYGCIADALIKNSCSNGILLFDELDKCKEKIHNTLLGIFDPLQNCKFRDAYFGNFPIDLSQNMMIICLNDLERINPILRDRLHIINIPGYSDSEKKIIISKYIIPKLESQYKISVQIDNDVIEYILNNTNQHKGVRQLIMYLTKIYELVVLDKFTNKFKFENRFRLKDLTHIKLSNNNSTLSLMYI